MSTRTSAENPRTWSSPGGVRTWLGTPGVSPFPPLPAGSHSVHTHRWPGLLTRGTVTTAGYRAGKRPNSAGAFQGTGSDQNPEQNPWARFCEIHPKPRAPALHSPWHRPLKRPQLWTQNRENQKVEGLCPDLQSPPRTFSPHYPSALEAPSRLGRGEGVSQTMLKHAGRRDVPAGPDSQGLS